MLVLAKGDLLRRYARVPNFGGQSYGDPEYYFRWKSVLSSAGFFSDVKQDIFVWNGRHKQWYRVHSVG